MQYVDLHERYGKLVLKNGVGDGPGKVPTYINELLKAEKITQYTAMKNVSLHERCARLVDSMAACHMRNVRGGLPASYVPYCDLQPPLADHVADAMPTAIDVTVLAREDEFCGLF
jgi:hypothetical protein